VLAGHGPFRSIIAYQRFGEKHPPLVSCNSPVLVSIEFVVARGSSTDVSRLQRCIVMLGSRHVRNVFDLRSFVSST
jgi:hypothetical protein